MLLSYQETGDFEFRSPRVEYVFTENTGDRIQKYLRHEEEKGRSEAIEAASREIVPPEEAVWDNDENLKSWLRSFNSR